MEKSTASTNPCRKGLDTKAEMHPGRRAALVARAIGEALVGSGTAIIGGLGYVSRDGNREGVAQEAQRALAHTGLVTEWQAFASDFVRFNPRSLLVASPMRVNATIVETVQR